MDHYLSRLETYLWGVVCEHCGMTRYGAVLQRKQMLTGGDGGCRVGEVRAGTTSPMPDHKGFKLQ